MKCIYCVYEYIARTLICHLSYIHGIVLFVYFVIIQADFSSRVVNGPTSSGPNPALTLKYKPEPEN